MSISKIFAKTFLKRNTSFLIVACGSLVLTIIDFKQSNVLGFYKQYLQTITFPIKNSIHKFVQIARKFPQEISYVTYNRQLASENKKLKLELLQLKQQFKRQFDENLSHQSENVVTAQVLGYEQGIFSSPLLIGTPNGIGIGNIVSADNGLVGLVTSIAGNVAFVTTIADKAISVPVKSKQGLHLVLKGNNENSMVAVAVQQDYNLLTSNFNPIKVGEILYTSGEGGVFKKNIPVAKVTEASQEIFAQPIVDLDNLDYVYLSAPVLSRRMQVE